MSLSADADGRDRKGKQELPPRGFPTFSHRDWTCCIGSALVLAWSFFLLWSPASFMLPALSDQQAHFLRMFFFLGAALSGIAMAPLSKTLLVGKGEIPICLVLLILMVQVTLLAYLPPIPGQLAWLSWTLAGLGMGGFLFLWTKYMTLMQMRKLFFLHGLSWTIGGMLFLICLHLPWGIHLIGPFVIIAAILQLSIQTHQDLRTELLRTRPEGAFSLKGFFKNSQLFSLGYSVGYGFILSYITTAGFSPGSSSLIATVMVLTAALYMLNMYLRFRNPGLFLYSFIIPLSFIFMAGAVGSRSTLWTCIFAGLSLFLFVWSDLTNATTAVVSARFHKENYSLFFGFTRGLTYLAMLTGWALAYWAGFISQGGSGLYLAAALAFACLAFLVSATFFDKDRLTLALSYAVGAADYEKRSQAEPLLRFFDEDDLFDLRDDEPAVEVVETTRLEDPLEEAIEIVAMEYHLSSREYEVLTYLAHGRNAEYIAKKLVISMATAKSHTYNIYTKLGVHSRQELMDLVESLAPPPPSKG